jgi:transcriptional regulator with XRE-family HTH domain
MTEAMEENETLGQRIRRIRHQRGMSLAKVVKDDFSRAFLNQVEMGKARPSVRVLRALLALKPAITSYDWPLGSDARVCRAQVLMAMGRQDEAAEILAREKMAIEVHGDRHRMERLRAVERGERFHYEGDAMKVHLQLADRAQRAGNNHDELEHYRAARVLLEAES